MKNSAERITFICDYIISYENKIKELNKQGLFDEAKLFELFASEVGKLYFGLSKPLKNLNIDTYSFPCVDLFSEEENIFFQVSTCQDVPTKIKKTLTKIDSSTNKTLKSLTEVFFIVLNNKSIDKVKNLKIGNVSFSKKKNLITTEDIIKKARVDLEFQKNLFLLLKKEEDLFSTDLKKFQEAVNYDSRVILNDIDEFINKSYYIDLSDQINEINFKKDKFVLISGEAGSGKSVLCKKLLENKTNVVCTRAEKLIEKGDVNQIWGFNIEDTFKLIKNDVFIYIDALEFIADSKNKLDVLDSLLERISKLDNIYLFCSCRSSDLHSFIKTITRYNIVEYKTKPIDEKKLNNLSLSFPVLKKIIKNNKYNSLFINPFYINFLLKLNNFTSIKDEEQLRRKMWKEIICLNRGSVEPIITNIVLERATNYLSSVDATNYDEELINQLLSNSVLIKTENGIRLKYDIFEDICFEQYIDKKFDEHRGDYLSFFSSLESIGRCIYRRYQIWIENKLFAKSNREKFLYTLLSSKSIPISWKKESMIGIIKSNYCLDFFNEYSSEIVNNNFALLKEFIDVTNLYGFEINKIPFNFDIFTLKNKGAGRESLIKIIYKYEFFKKDFPYKPSIEQLIYDYLCSITSKEIALYSFEILNFYVENIIKDDCYIDYKIIQKEVRAIYKLSKYAGLWIKEFFKKLFVFIEDKNKEKNKFGDEAIKDILTIKDYDFIDIFALDILRFYELYFTYIINDDFPYYHRAINDNLNSYNLFGLNYNAERYSHESYKENPLLFLNFYLLLCFKFDDTFNWYLQFLNKTIDIYKTKLNNTSSVTCFFENSIKEYVGTSNMWMTGESLNNVPTILSDMTYILKYTINYKINNKGLIDSRFANKIKGIILEKTNNIIGLSIISNIGLKYEKEIPGYCFELLSSPELVRFDQDREYMTNSQIRKFTVNFIANSLGFPPSYFSNDRYKKVTTNNNLKNYALTIQFNGSTLSKNLFNLFDYLFSNVYNKPQYNYKSQELKKLDIRESSIKKLGENKYQINPPLTKLEKQQQVELINKNLELQNLNNKIKNIDNKIETSTITIKDIDEIIKDFISIKDENEFFVYAHFLIIFIAFALSQLKFSDKKRDYYCSIWIELGEKQLENLPLDINNSLYRVLFNQLDSKISDETKRKIKKILLRLLIEKDNQNNIQYILFDVARSFLENNKKYGKLYFNTILLLSEDEMNHQYFNYKYLKKRRQTDKKTAFIPNMQPRLSGVDYYIEQDKEERYNSRKDEIIEKYLFEEKEINFSNIDIKNYDIRIISHVFSCGLNLANEFDKTFISKYIEQLLNIYNVKSYSPHDIIGYYEIHEVEDYFKKNLKVEESYSLVLEVLFDRSDYSIFKSDTVDFYLNILCSLTEYYFKSKDKRKHIEKIIYLMEKHINKISNEAIRNELTKSLFLGFSRFGGMGDWSDYKPQFSFSDKVFLNNMFAKYGYLHFYDLLKTIDKLQYKELLPEILISIYYSFDKYIKLEKHEKNELNKIINIINEIMFFAFMNHSDYIKGDYELTNAYEGILQILIELKDKKAPVLLDEFRIH